MDSLSFRSSSHYVVHTVSTTPEGTTPERALLPLPNILCRRCLWRNPSKWGKGLDAECHMWTKFVLCVIGARRKMGDRPACHRSYERGGYRSTQTLPTHTPQLRTSQLRPLPIQTPQFRPLLIQTTPIQTPPDLDPPPQFRPPFWP